MITKRIPITQDNQPLKRHKILSIDLDMRM